MCATRSRAQLNAEVAIKPLDRELQHAVHAADDAAAIEFMHVREDITKPILRARTTTSSMSAAAMNISLR